jgi:hypothetical protein
MLASLAVAAPDARADDPAPSRVNAAAEEYDRGRRAFLAKSYEEAAVHFENAFRDAPRVEALRNAIRARRAASQPDRAATLAALALQMYRDDAPTKALAQQTLDEAKPKLLAIAVKCATPCSLLVDGRVAPSAVSIDHTLYVPPGTHELSVGFKTGNVVRPAEGKAGDSITLAFEAPPPPETPPAPPETPPPPRPGPEVRPPPPPDKPLGPAIFFIGAGLTVAAGAATVVSGLDAQNNPGVDAVRRECAGKDESCPLYQDGKSAELRTNVLLGATAGLGVVTAVVGLFFTQWSSPERTRGASVTPYVSRDGVGVFGRF